MPPAIGKWWFDLHTDGSGYDDLIIPGGGFRDRFPADREACYVHMNGKNIFNFTIKRVPPLIEDTLAAAGMTREQDRLLHFPPVKSIHHAPSRQEGGLA